MFKFITLCILSLAMVASISPQSDAAGRKISGFVTSNDNQDTTFTGRGCFSILVWNPDAECRIRIVTHVASGNPGRATMLFPASNKMQEIFIESPDSVHVFKTASQRVGVFFLGR